MPTAIYLLATLQSVVVIIYTLRLNIIKLPSTRVQCIFGVSTRVILRMYNIYRLDFVTEM
jgi:hypothetical protein